MVFLSSRLFLCDVHNTFNCQRNIGKALHKKQSNRGSPYSVDENNYTTHCYKQWQRRFSNALAHTLIRSKIITNSNVTAAALFRDCAACKVNSRHQKFLNCWTAQARDFGTSVLTGFEWEFHILRLSRCSQPSATFISPFGVGNGPISNKISTQVS